MEARSETLDSTGRSGWANRVPGVRSAARAVAAAGRLAVLGLLLQPVAVWATEYIWDHAGATSGTRNWSDPTSWNGDPDPVPTFVAGDTLYLNPDATLTGDATCYLNTTGNITLGIIKFTDTTDANQWTISPSGTQVFHMDNGAAAAVIENTKRRYSTVAVPLVLHSNLELNNSDAANRANYDSFTLSGGITSANGALTISNVTGTKGAVVISGSIGDGAAGNTVSVVQNAQNAASWMILSGANTFTGGLRVEAGTVAANDQSMNANNLTVNGGVFELYINSTVKIGGLAGTSSGIVRTGKTALNGSTALSSTLEISPAAGSYTFAGVLANNTALTPNGVLSLKKTGNGTQILSGTSTYTGATAVNVGTLLVNGTLSGAGGSVTVAGGGKLGGTGTIERAVQFEAGSAMQVTSGDTPNHLKVTGAVTLDSSSALDVVGTLTEKTYTVLTATGVTGEFDPASAPSGYVIAYTPTGAPDTVTLEKVPAGTLLILH